MIKLEKLEKGEFFEDAFLVSYRYNKDYLNKISLLFWMILDRAMMILIQISQSC